MEFRVMILQCVFERLDTKILEQKLTQWIRKLLGSVVQEVIPIDGTTLRGSYDRDKGLKNLHLVTAWASEHRLILGQIKVEDRSNQLISFFDKPDSPGSQPARV